VVYFYFGEWWKFTPVLTQRSLAATITVRTEVQVITGEVESELTQASHRAQQSLVKSEQWIRLKQRLIGLAQNT